MVKGRGGGRDEERWWGTGRSTGEAESERRRTGQAVVVHLIYHFAILLLPGLCLFVTQLLAVTGSDAFCLRS